MLNETFEDEDIDDIELLEYYMELINESIVVKKTLIDRKVLNEEVDPEEIYKVYENLIKNKLINAFVKIGKDKEDAIKEVSKRMNRKCRICGCSELHGCQNGCYWVEEDLCSSCVNKEINV